jgi:glyoxylase-like metal-dependent hydrolase (beta-lactamase superfamily II)
MFSSRTPTLPPATHTNSYAIGADEVILVEPATPYDDEQRAWLEWARALPSHGRTPIAIVLTHHHEDHVGGASVFARELGLPLWAHEATRARLEKHMQFTRTLRDGENLLDSWRVLHTPGHAPGHICLHDERTGTLVCGDMVASVGTILIAPGDGDMRVYLEQLARLDALGAKVALPAHGDPIDDPHAVFTRYVAHRAMRERKIVDAIRREPRSASDLLPDVYADTPAMMWPAASLSLQAHLDKLTSEGRATRDDENVYRLLA